MAYNLTRQSSEFLNKYEDSPPSLSIQLHADVWTLNSGSKFLYNGPQAALLDDIRAYRIPVDLLELFDAAKVPFYEGCMIVELQDYRSSKVKDKKIPEEARPPYEATRIVLRPNPESIWTDLCLLNQKNGGKWTDRDALEVEARILIATSQPLCLEPDPHLGRIANSMFRVSVPRPPPPLRPRKRKAAALDQPEVDEKGLARRAKIVQFMNPQRNRSLTPSYRLLDTIQRSRTRPAQSADDAGPSIGHPQNPSSIQPPPPTAASAAPAAPSPVRPPEPKKAKTAKKRDGSQTPGMVSEGTAGTPTPAATPISATPQLAARQAVQPSPRPPSQSPHPAAAYAGSPPDSSKVAPSPAPAAHAASPPRPPSQPATQAHAQHPPQPAHPTYQQQPTQPFPANGAQFMVPQAYNGAKPRNAAAMQAQLMPPNSSQAQYIYAQQMRQYAQSGGAAVPARFQPNQNQKGQQQPQQQQPPMSRTPIAQGQANGQARASPMVANQPIASRSPMPAANHTQAQQHHPAQAHPGLTQAQRDMYTAQYIQAMQRGQPGGPAAAAAAAAAGQQHQPQNGAQGQQNAGQEQGQQQVHPQMMAQYPAVFNFGQMGNAQMQLRIPQGYAWPMSYRGVPMNGQMTGMAPGTPQQIPTNANKTGQGGMQGR